MTRNSVNGKLVSAKGAQRTENIVNCHGWKNVVEGWDYTGVLKAEESGWDRQRGRGKVFHVVGYRINKSQMAGRSAVFLVF